MTITKTLSFGAVFAGLLATAACSTGGDITGTCDQFLDTTEEAMPVTITVTNDGADPIYLLGTDCSHEVDLFIRDAQGNVIPRSGGTCGYTCEDLQTEELFCAEPAICAQPPVIKIEPGGHYDLTWDGFITPQVNMPSGCFETQGVEADGATCMQRQVAPDATYQAAVSIANSVDCGGEACDCEADADGVCTIDFGYADEVLEAMGEAAYPSETTIDILVGAQPQN